MSRAAEGAGEGVSRYAQRKAAKAMMYAQSTEQEGAGILGRRMHLQGGTSKYAPHVGGWQGKAWGLAGTKVAGGRGSSAPVCCGPTQGQRR